MGYEFWRETENTKNDPNFVCHDVNAPIRERTVDVNDVSEPMLIVGDKKGTKCPWKIGLDFIITPEIGLQLYEIFDVFMNVPVTTEIYGIYPEAREEFIPQKAYIHKKMDAKTNTMQWDFCGAPTWTMSGWFEVTYEVYLGAKLEIEKLQNLYYKMASWGSTGEIDDSAYVEAKKDMKSCVILFCR